jgi:uncharacterized delta-60 repeat protein
MSIISAAFVGLALIAPAAALAQTLPGYQDPSFGGGNFVVTASPWGYGTGSGFGTLNRVLVQSDGKVLVVGHTTSTNRFGAMRFNPDGSPDASFGQGGSAVPAIGYGQTGSGPIDAAIQPDGKIVLIDSGFTATRLTANGSLDTGFGTDGVTTFVQHKYYAIGMSSAVAIGPGGKIIIVGYDGSANTIIARLNPDGSKDATLSHSGYVTNSHAGFQIIGRKCLLVGSDGRITVAGTTASGAQLARYVAAGTLDTTFGTGGKVRFSVSGGPDAPRGLVVTADGRLLVGGQLQNQSGLFFARFNAAGAADIGFGAGGHTSILHPVSDTGGVSLQGSDGGAVIATTFEDGSGVAATFEVWRINGSGAPDAAFGPWGPGLSQPLGQPGAYSDCRDLAVDPTGRIILAGSAGMIGPELGCIRGQ